MECARIGHAASGTRLTRTCLTRLADAVPPQLQHFYRSHRAGTRAKLYVWRAGEPDGGDVEGWLATARDYLRIAREAVVTASG